MRFRCFSLLVFLLITTVSWANHLSTTPTNIIITGSVTGTDGEPLVGANVVVPGTYVGTITDF